MKKIGLILIAVYHGLLFVVCSMNLMANNFVLKASRFYDEQLVSSDLMSRWILLAPIALPLWMRALRSAGMTGFRITPAFLILAFCSICLNYPFALTGAQGVDFWDILRAAVRDGLTQPSAFCISVLSLVGLIEFRNVEEKRLQILIPAMGLAAVLFKFILAGAALPRLEDEVAYFIQSLIFESGSRHALLIPPTGMAVESLKDAAFLPFLIQTGNEYYRAHMHGWSIVLSLFSMVHAKSIATLVFTLLNIGLFYALSRHFLSEAVASARIIALSLFVASPVLLFLSNTYMSHTLALALSQCVVLAHAKLTRLRPIWMVVFVLASVAAFFVRPQSIVPLMAALVVYEMLRLAWGEAKAASALRMLLILLSCGLAYGALSLYADWMRFDSVIPMTAYVKQYLVDGCQSLGFGPGHGCFPTYGTFGHSFRKTIWNIGDLMARCNQELAVGGVPLVLGVIVLIVRHFRKIRMDGPETLFLLILVITIGEFGLYFHNGGESYRGRYLAEVAFALMLLVGLLIRHETILTSRAASVAAMGIAFALPVISLFQIRGEYFHPVLGSFSSVGDRNPLIRDSLIRVEPVQGGVETVRSEFGGPDETIELTRRKRYLNLGYGTLAATAVRVNANGLLEDARGNVLLGDISDEDAQRFGRPVYLLRYSAYEPVTKSSKIVRIWKRSPAFVERRGDSLLKSENLLKDRNGQ